MNKRNFPFIIVVIALIAGAAYYFISYAPAHKPADKDSLATGYATQPLTAPFTLVSRTWDESAGDWRYFYTAAGSEPDALAAAKSQLGTGAYQVDARQPDQITAGSATLYRDLITEDVALKVQIAPATTGSATAAAVTVTLSQMNK